MKGNERHFRWQTSFSLTQSQIPLTSIDPFNPSACIPGTYTYNTLYNIRKHILSKPATLSCHSILHHFNHLQSIAKLTRPMPSPNLIWSCAMNQSQHVQVLQPLTSLINSWISSIIHRAKVPLCRIWTRSRRSVWSLNEAIVKQLPILPSLLVSILSILISRSNLICPKASAWAITETASAARLVRALTWLDSLTSSHL